MTNAAATLDQPEILLGNWISKHDTSDAAKSLLGDTSQQLNDLRRDGAMDVFVVRARFMSDEDTRTSVHLSAQLGVKSVERTRRESVRLAIPIHASEDDDWVRPNIDRTGDHHVSMRFQLARCNASGFACPDRRFFTIRAR